MEILQSIVAAMSPEILLSLLLQVTTTLTSRYRARSASRIFTLIIIDYFDVISHITAWHFERILLYYLDLVQLDSFSQGLADVLAACAQKRGVYTDLVKRALDGFVKDPMSVSERLDFIKRLDNSTEVKRRKIIIEGKFGGRQCSEGEQYGSEDLGGNQGDPDWFCIETIPDFTLDDLKAMIYDHINLRPELQRIEFKNDDGNLVVFKETDTLKSIEAASTEVSLYLHAIPYCPPSRSTQRIETKRAKINR